MNRPLNLILFAIVAFVIAFLWPGVDWLPALIIAVVLGCVNCFIRPALRQLGFKISALSVSVATFLIMWVFLIGLFTVLFSGFGMALIGIWATFVFALFLAVANFLIQFFLPEEK